MRVMVDIAHNDEGDCIPLRDVAERQGLSKKYLEQIVKPLVDAGLLIVTRGNQGGYRLGRDACEITLGDILDATEGGLQIVECTGEGATCERMQECEIHDMWCELQALVGSFLESRTLGDIAGEECPPTVRQ